MRNGPEEAPTLALRSQAAALLVAGRGVVSGYSAAELLGASCAPFGAPAEVTLLHGRQRAHPGLLVHRNQVTEGELWQVGEVLLTSPLRTAYDLARRLGLVEGVVAVDRLTDTHRVAPDLLLNFAVHYPHARGDTRIAGVFAQATPYSCSPMESRLRLLLVHAGLPRPQVQWAVQDPATRTAVWLDLHPPRRPGVADLPVHEVRDPPRAGPHHCRHHPRPRVNGTPALFDLARRTLVFRSPTAPDRIYRIR